MSHHRWDFSFTHNNEVIIQTQKYSFFPYQNKQAVLPRTLREARKVAACARYKK